MKTRKCGVFAVLAAVLLVTVVLVTTCTEPVTSDLTVSKGKGINLPPPPAGMAYIVLSIPGAGAGAAKTILPIAPGTLYYKVDILSDTGGTNYTQAAGDGDVDFSDSDTEVFTIPVDDDYNITVGAYTTAAFTAGTLVGVGQTTSPITVSSGVGTASVTLEKIADGTTTGVFNWYITLPTGDNAPDSANITVASYPAGTTVYTSAITTNTLGTMTPPPASGIYWVKATYGKTKYESKTYSEILHINGNLPSSWGTALSPKVLANLSKNAYDVEYDLNFPGAYTTTPPAGAHNGVANTLIDDHSGNGWPHRGTVELAGLYDASGSGTTPARGGHTFDGWFTTATSQITKWIFDGEPGTESLIYKDTTLYAKWTLNTGLTITIDPPEYATEKTFAFSVANYEFTQSVARTAIEVGSPPPGLTINVTATTTPFDSVVGWFFGDALAPADRISSTATLTYADISGAGIDLTRMDDFLFTFVAMKDGEQYSGTFTISIVAD